MAELIVPGIGFFDDTLPAGQYVVPGIGNLEAAGSGGTNATATGATLTGTGTLAPGSASGQQSPTAPGANLTGSGSLSAGSAAGSGDATAPGTTLTGTGTLAAGSASGTTSGSFTSEIMVNNTNVDGAADVQANVACSWSWWKGSVGSTPTSLTHGTGTTDSSGRLTISGLPSGAGFLLVVTADGSIYYQPATVS